MLRLEAHEGIAYFVAAGETLFPGARELALSEEDSSEHGQAGEENGGTSVPSGEDHEDERRDRDDPGEELLHDPELAPLAESDAKQERRAGVGQRGDETAQEDHVRTRIPDRR